VVDLSENTQPKYHMGDGIFDPQRAHPDDAHTTLMRLIPNGSRVLELGCSSGYLSGYMQQALACSVTGLEFDPVATRIAQQRCSEVYTVDLDAPDALAQVKPNPPYDVLLAAAVLEHLKYPERLLQDVRAYLKPDARVIVSLPNIAHWTFRLKLLAGQFDYSDYGVMDKTHTHLYTLKTGRALLENNGYHVEAVYIAGSLLQNSMNKLARALKYPLPPLLLPGLFAYELIYIAKPR
jgi:methionine biosynthesis protein MetW